MARSIERWAPSSEDGPTHPKRLTPWIDFGGFGRVSSPLAFDSQQGRDVVITTDVSVDPHGHLLFVVANDFTYRRLVSAQMDASGALTQIIDTACKTGITQPPLITDNGFVLCTGESGSAGSKVSAHGSLGRVTALDAVGAAVRLTHERFVVERHGMLRVCWGKTDGELSDGIAAPILGGTTVPGGLTAHAGKLVLVTNQNVASYVFSGTSLSLLDTVKVMDGDDVACTPAAFVRRGVGVIADRDTGVMRTFVMRADGTLATKHARAFNAPVGRGIVTVGDLAIFGCGNDVRTVRVGADGEITPIGCFHTGAAVVARPTVTRDCVVIIGSADSNLYALQLDDSGVLIRRASYGLGGPITTAATVTADGYVLAASDKGLFSLKD